MQGVKIVTKSDNSANTDWPVLPAPWTAKIDLTLRLPFQLDTVVQGLPGPGTVSFSLCLTSSPETMICGPKQKMILIYKFRNPRVELMAR